MLKKLIIIGTGITSQRIYNFIKQYDLYVVVGFAVDKSYLDKQIFNNLPVYDLETLDTRINKKDDLLFVAMAWDKLNKDRKDTYLRLKSAGYNFANIISPHSHIYGEITGDNCWIADNVVIETGAVLNSNTIVDHNAFIGTFTKIDQHCYIAVSSVIAGGCHISEQCFVGLGATVFNRIKIGKKCLIGACTVIKRNIDDYSIVKTISATNVVIKSSDSEIENKLIGNFNKR